MREEFVIAVSNRYDALYNESDDEEKAELDVEQKWSKIKECIHPPSRKYLAKLGERGREREREIEEDMDERRHLETR